jgi:hypothetical protein
MWALLFGHHEDRSPTYGIRADARGRNGGFCQKLVAGVNVALGEEALTNTQTWLSFADTMIERGYAILKATIEPFRGHWGANPRVVGQALVARTLSNARAALSLIRAGSIVEARVLTRCCLENYFWITVLERDREEFLKAMLKDEMTNRRARGLFVNNAGFDLSSEVGQKYLAEIQRMSIEWKYPKIPVRSVAEMGPIKNAYVLYGHLSSDAAHPSYTALKRYIRSSEAEPVFDPVLAMDEAEAVATLEQLCLCTVGACANLAAITATTPESLWVTTQSAALAAEFHILASK